MATYTYTEDAQDLYANYNWYGFFAADLEETDHGDGTYTTYITLEWGEPWDSYGYDEIVITVSYSDDDLHEYEEGEYAGDGTLIGGTLDSIEYFSDDDLLVTITDLPDDLAPYLASLLSDEFVNTAWIQNFYSAVETQGNFYLGTTGVSDEDEDIPGDVIYTGAGKDSVNAKSGDDVIFDAGGRDVYNGAAGVDLLNYGNVWWNPAGVIQGIDANLVTGKVVGWDGKTDKVSNIEEVVGTFLADTFTGDDLDNTFVGLSGTDHFDGGDGFDRLDYSDDDDQGGMDGIKVDAAAQTVRDGFGFTDTYENIERISGTNYRDNFVDDDSDMYYDGRDGDDVFRVRGGDDTLRGREGADEFRFIGTEFGNNVIRDWEKNVDSVSINKLSNMSQLIIYQDGDDAIVEFTRYATHSTIEFRDTDVSELTDDVFGF